jgi:hypothetical protein
VVGVRSRSASGGKATSARRWCSSSEVMKHMDRVLVDDMGAVQATVPATSVSTNPATMIATRT